MGSPSLLLEEDLSQSLNGDLLGNGPVGDLLVLAVDAVQGAPAEEDRPAAPRTANGRFLPVVECSAGELDTGVLGAVASRSRKAVDLAGAGAERAAFKQGGRL